MCIYVLCVCVCVCVCVCARPKMCSSFIPKKKKHKSSQTSLLPSKAACPTHSIPLDILTPIPLHRLAWSSNLEVPLNEISPVSL